MKKLIILFLSILTFSLTSQTSSDNPRVGIVISKTSFTHAWGVVQMSAHGWGGVVNLAGIPYDCFFVEDLNTEMKLDNYKCLIFTQCSYMTNAVYNELIKVITGYTSNGGNIIIDGLLGHFDENTKQRDHSQLDKLLGINYLGFSGNPEYRIKVKSDAEYITRNFNKGQYVTQHLAGGLNIQTFADSANVLLELSDGSKTYPFLSINTKTDKNRIVLVNDFATWSGVPSIFRNVHPQVFYNNTIYDLLIESVYWTVYGPQQNPFPSLQVSNADITAIIRLDADASGNLNAQIQTINYLIDIAKETGVVPVYAWVSSTAASAGWQDIAPLGKRLEAVGGQIGTHSKFHNIDTEMNEQRWKEELDDAKYEIEFNMADYGYDIGKVNWFINPGNTIHMSDYGQVAKRFDLYMTHGFEQDMPIGFGNFTWFNEEYKNFVVLENTPSPDYQWFYDPTWSYTTQQITAYEENIFDHLYYNVQRGVIFNQMWHDYSITSQPQYGKDRIVNKNNIAMYDAIKAKFKNNNIYAPEPEDLRYKLCIMAQADYQWSVNDDVIKLKLDLSAVSLDSVQNYTGGMGIRINNSSKYISKVTINGAEHFAFNKDVVILPNLNNNVADISITLGDAPAVEPVLNYVSKRLPFINKTDEGLSFEILTKSYAKYSLYSQGNFILLNSDGFRRKESEQNVIEGYVNSDRKVELRKINTDKIKFKSAAVEISDIILKGNNLVLKLRNENINNKPQLSFNSNQIDKIVFDNTEIKTTSVSYNNMISFPPFTGEKELTIYLK